jgi:hypothetical protein
MAGMRRTANTPGMLTVCSQRSAPIGPRTNGTDLQAGLLDYASRVGDFHSPSVVLDALHAIINKSLPLGVLGAARLPINDTDWVPVRGKSVFLHKDVPDGWWEEYDALARGNSVQHCFWPGRALHPTPGLRFNGCSSQLGLIGGRSNCVSSTACAMG